MFPMFALAMSFFQPTVQRAAAVPTGAAKQAKSYIASFGFTPP